MNSIYKNRIRDLVSALRSGKYKQTTNALRCGDSFCCLGVACDLAKAQINGKWDGNEFIDSDREKDLLTPRVRDYYGFGGTDPLLIDADGDHIPAAELNDNGVSFDEIADAFVRTFLK